VVPAMLPSIWVLGEAQATGDSQSHRHHLRHQGGMETRARAAPGRSQASPRAGCWPPSPPCCPVHQRCAHRLGAAVLQEIFRVFYFPLAPLASVDGSPIYFFGKKKIQAPTPNLASTQAQIPASDGNRHGIKHNRRDFNPSAWVQEESAARASTAG
jgi:hypothetical protein